MGDRARRQLRRWTQRGYRVIKGGALFAIAAATVTAAAAGCGDGDKEQERKAQPKAKAPLSAELRGVNKAFASQSCQEYAPYALAAVRPPEAKVGGPPVKDECKFFRRFLQDNKDVELEKTQEFGTAAIASGPGPKRGGFSTYTAMFVLDWDGRYRLVGSQPADPQIGTKPKPGTDLQAAAEGFVRAVRDKDCQAFERYTLPGSGIYFGARSAQEVCKQVFGGKNLAPQLAADRGAKPQKLGETLDIGFFGLATKDNYYTLLVQTKPVGGVPPAIAKQLRGKPNALVSDVFPNYRPVR